MPREVVAYEAGRIERLGSSKPISVDVRIVAAANRDLEKGIAQGTFREDLYYRLNVFPIRIPPLRERPDDIPMLVWGFVDEFSKAFGKQIESVSKDSMLALQRYHWPGNIRELRNVVERAVIVANGPRLSIDLPKPSATAAPPAHTSTALVDMERDHIVAVLDRVKWRVRGAGGTADLLGMKPSTSKAAWRSSASNARGAKRLRRVAWRLMSATGRRQGHRAPRSGAYCASQ